MVTPINKITAKIGTQGFLAPSVDDINLRSLDDIEDLKRPDVFLNASRLWEWITGGCDALSGQRYGKLHTGSAVRFAAKRRL